MTEGTHNGNVPSQKPGSLQKVSSRGQTGCFCPVSEALVDPEERCHLPDKAEL
jgi:hypothetical protein